MARYRQIPELVDARQFTGGKENAVELNQWLTSKGCTSTWVDNQTVMDIHLVERLQFTTPEQETIFRSAYRKDWIVNRGTTWRVFSNKEFNERFEVV